MALRAPSKKQPGADGDGRPLRDIAPFYSRWINRQREFVLDAKPCLLQGIDSIDQKVWRQYRVHLDRRSPLERAEFYAREMMARRAASHRALSVMLGEPVNRVGRYLKLLVLPEPIKQFLREHREQIYLRYFTENRLQLLLRIADPREAWLRFREMVGQAERDPGLWRKEVR